MIAEHIFVPYRVCFVGSHIDHQQGKTTSFAINKGINIVYTINGEGTISVKSKQFDLIEEKWSVIDTFIEKEDNWSDYLRGITVSLRNRYKLSKGINATIDGDLPSGGLGSSASLSIAFLLALSKANDIKLTTEEIIEIAKESENKYVGIQCGLLDHSSVVYSIKNQLLILDTKLYYHETICVPTATRTPLVGIFFSGIERQLKNTDFNDRVIECHNAAVFLDLLSKNPFNHSVDVLSDIPYYVYKDTERKLPKHLRKRAKHFFDENDRVYSSILAWKKGDFKKFGKLSFESCKSSINNYEVGSKQLNTLYKILKHTKGVYGGRFAGAGFNGYFIALIDEKYKDDILHKVEKKYLKHFPELKGKYQACICETTNGIEELLNGET